MRLKSPRFRSRAYLAYVVSQGCLICRGPAVAHHLLRGSGHGVGLKAGDDQTLPLCDGHHRELHAKGNETRYLEEHGIDGPTEAARLFEMWRAK
jgi:hypothetical protein